MKRFSTHHERNREREQRMIREALKCHDEIMREREDQQYRVGEVELAWRQREGKREAWLVAAAEAAAARLRASRTSRKDMGRETAPHELAASGSE